jgi:hypothetical protein
MKNLRVAVLCAWALAVSAALCGSVASAGAAASGRSPSPQSASTSSRASGSAGKKRKSKKKRVAREPSQKAPTPERITEIQSALARGGYYDGDTNGKWDANTVAAVEKFQSAHGIESSGKLDAPTLQKLGLGSDIAGVSAPTPVKSPNCCSAAPSTGTAAPASQAQPSGTPSAATSGAVSGAVSGQPSGSTSPTTSSSPFPKQ